MKTERYLFQRLQARPIKSFRAESQRINIEQIGYSDFSTIIRNNVATMIELQLKLGS